MQHVSQAFLCHAAAVMRHVSQAFLCHTAGVCKARKLDIICARRKYDATSFVYSWAKVSCKCGAKKKAKLFDKAASPSC